MDPEPRDDANAPDTAAAAENNKQSPSGPPRTASGANYLMTLFQTSPAGQQDHELCAISTSHDAPDNTPLTSKGPIFTSDKTLGDTGTDHCPLSSIDSVAAAVPLKKAGFDVIDVESDDAAPANLRAPFHIYSDAEEMSDEDAAHRSNLRLYGHNRSEWNQGATSSYLTSHSWDPSRLLESAGRIPAAELKSMVAKSAAAIKLGTIKGVLLPCLQNIWGVIMFVRLPWITGVAGVGLSIVIVSMAVLCTLLTSISLSAIATNGHVPAGGCYYIISRSLGKELGVSVGLLFYLTNTIGASMYILGAVEILTQYLAPSMSVGALVHDSRIYGSALLSFLSIVALLGMRRVNRFALLFLGAVIMAITAILVGLFASNRPGLPRNEVVGFPGELGQNIAPGFEKPDLNGNINPDGVDFFRLFAIFFPSVTGIMAGSNRSGDLANAGKSIPAGTLGSIAISSSVYYAFVLLFGTVCTGAFLRTKLPSNGLHVAVVSWPHPLVTLIGILFSSIGAALQCLVSAPRLLQAVAKDDVIPLLAWFKKTNNGEPRRALIPTLVLAHCAVLIGSLDAVAPITTMLYLTCYAFVNFSTGLLSVLQYPNWRPSWRWYHWSLSFLGAFICIAYMFMINYIFALVAFVLVLLLYKYVEYRGAQVEWGDGLTALNLNVAQKNLLALERRRMHAKNWKPQIMTFIDLDDDSLPTNPALLCLLSQLRKAGGLSIVTSVLPGDILTVTKSKEMNDVQETLELLMKQHDIKGFAQVLAGFSALDARLHALQAVGIGILRPNCILMGYPKDWRKDRVPSQQAHEFVYTVKTVIASEKVVLALKPSDKLAYPNCRSSSRSEGGPIDVYWIMHDGGILTLLPYLLRKHRVWKKCPLRVFCIAEAHENSVQILNDLKSLLQRFRIDAEAHVVEMGDNDISEFTYEKTLQMQQRAELLNEMRLNERGQVIVTAPKSLPRKKPQKEKAEFMNTSVKLNLIIRENSENASLIFLSLPRPARSQTPNDYMEYLDALTVDLPHVILVKGSGFEVVTTIV